MGYLTEQASILINAQDEVAAIPNGERVESPFALALRRSSLARSLKKGFDGITERGVCEVSINGWPHVHYCIPQKVGGSFSSPSRMKETIDLYFDI